MSKKKITPAPVVETTPEPVVEPAPAVDTTPEPKEFAKVRRHVINASHGTSYFVNETKVFNIKTRRDGNCLVSFTKKGRELLTDDLFDYKGATKECNYVDSATGNYNTLLRELAEALNFQIEPDWLYEEVSKKPAKGEALEIDPDIKGTVAENA